MATSNRCRASIYSSVPLLGLFLIFVLYSQGVKGAPYSLQFDYCNFFHGKCIKACDLRKEVQFGRVNFLCKGGMRCCVPGIRHPKKSPKQTDAKAPTPLPKSETKTTFSTLLSSSSSSSERPSLSSTLEPSSTTRQTTGVTQASFLEDNNKSQNSTTFLSEDELLHETSGSPNISVPRCGVPMHSLNKRVIGGIEAERCVFPWMVYIARDKVKDDVCGGTLVSDRHIITAAHCYDNLKGRWPSLILGEYDKREDKPGSKFSTTEYTLTVHPGYNKLSYRNDIAILTLTTPIPIEDYECIHPICLPEVDHALYVGKQCTVAGWGTTSKNLFKKAVHSTPMLMKTKLEIIHDSVCFQKFRHLFMSDSEICAGDLSGSTDSCVGDSGGPLMCTVDDDVSKINYLLGVVSSGAIPCARKGIPAIYTDVRAERKWIDRIMKKA